MPYIAHFHNGHEDQVKISGSAMKPYGLDYYIGLAQDNKGIKHCLFFPPEGKTALISFGQLITIYKEG